jgi:ribosome-binding factor A
MVAKIRQQKIAERIREEMSELLIGALTDPRVSGITVTDVTVDRELAYATIFVTSFEGSGRKQEVLEGLENARSFIRYQLSQRIDLRSFPQLRFKWDSTPERAERIEKLFDALALAEKQNQESHTDDADS